MLNILKCCDLFLPSGNELVALTDATDEEGAIEEIFRLGVSEVIASDVARSQSRKNMGDDHLGDCSFKKLARRQPFKRQACACRR
ncbi:hypothetical protein CGLAMM_11520 [Acetobacteraceae bacterium EV16G]